LTQKRDLQCFLIKKTLEAADHLINHFVSEFIVYHKNQRR